MSDDAELPHVAALEQVREGMKDVQEWLEDADVKQRLDTRDERHALYKSIVDSKGWAGQSAALDLGSHLAKHIEMLLLDHHDAAMLGKAMICDLIGINASLRRMLAGGICVYCGTMWSQTGEPNASPDRIYERTFDPQVSDEEAEKIKQQTAERIKAHHLECPKHPMRAIEHELKLTENRLATANADIAGLNQALSDCERSHRARKPSRPD
jgi:hypothetical protein